MTVAVDVLPDAVSQVLDAPANTPPYVQAEPPPGWTSSEFISTMGVHLLNVLAVLLDMLHIDWHKGLSALQGLIPIAALIVSAVIQVAYQSHRTQLKIAHIEKTATVKVEQLRAVGKEVLPTVLPMLTAAEGLVSDPEVKKQLGSIQEAISRLEAAWSAHPSQPNSVTVNVPVAAGSGYDTGASAGDPTASSTSDPTAGGLYLTGEAAIAQLAAEASIPSANQP